MLTNKIQMYVKFHARERYFRCEKIYTVRTISLKYIVRSRNRLTSHMHSWSTLRSMASPNSVAIMASVGEGRP